MATITKIQQGDSLEEVQLDPVSRIDLIKYAGASGDFNPIHTIDEEAKNAGLPGIIAHGMWTMGNLAKLFTSYHEEGYVKDYEIRFTGMVFLEDVVTLKAVAENVTDSSIDFEVRAVNQRDEDVIKGKITFAFH